MPKCVVVDPAHTWGDDRPPARPWGETTIYEAYARGLTRRHPDVPEPLRGTFAGLGHPAVIDHLMRLGVTALELLPIHAFVDDRHLLAKGLKNYWGYNTFGFFAPHAPYLSTPGLNGREGEELRATVAQLHAAGIEVILDVVYNHTAEGNHLGPTLSFKGIDNVSYYRLLPDNQRYYIDETGTGNTLNLTHPRVIQMVADSLRLWVEEYHIDGFRFDLCTTLGRETYGFDPHGGFFDAASQDPVLRRVKLIAEPWDVGPGGYQVGNHPPGWAEWNDKFRDDVRAFWRGDPGRRPDLAKRLTGSSELFGRRGRRPWASVNFVTSHDGFTLADLTAFNDKHNEANGEENRDGHSHNLSYNYGAEGPTEESATQETRDRQRRNFLATLLLSQGTPMLLGGDELARSQGGNNNAYAQDNEVSWFDWAGADPDLAAFVARLTALRRRHPVLRRGRFLHGSVTCPDGAPDVGWFSPAGVPMDEAAWHDPIAKALGVILNGRARPAGSAEPEDAALLVVLSAADVEVPFTLPPVPGGDAWATVLDTAEPARVEWPAPTAPGTVLARPPRSLIVLQGVPSAAGNRSAATDP